MDRRMESEGRPPIKKRKVDENNSYSETVYVQVGPEKTAFAVHSTVLTKQSPFFGRVFEVSVYPTFFAYYVIINHGISGMYSITLQCHPKLVDIPSNVLKSRKADLSGGLGS